MAVLAAIAAFFTGAVNVTPTNIITESTSTIAISDSRTYSSTHYGFSFKYPSTIAMSDTGSKFSLSHSVPFVHPDPCNMKDYTVLNDLTDFSLSGEIKDGNAETVLMNDNYYGLEFDTNNKPILDNNDILKKLDNKNISGYVFSMGVEGCGADVYYISLNQNRTLILTKSWVGEFSEVNGDHKKFKNLGGVILPEQSMSYMNDILGSIKLSPVTSPSPSLPTQSPTSCTPNWKCGWGECNGGYQAMIAVDSNNCGVPHNGAPLACPAMVKMCL